MGVPREVRGAVFWSIDAILKFLDGGQEQVVSAEIDLEKLRRYREEGIPPMLKDRRPELYRRFLYTEAEDRAAAP